MQKPSSCVMFNLSTLVTTADRMAAAYRYACGEMGFLPPEPDEIKALLGDHTLPQITDKLTPHITAGPRTEFYNLCNQKTLRLIGKVKGNDVVPADVRALLDELAMRGIRLGVFSGMFRPFVEKILAHNGLACKGPDNDGMFDVVTATERSPNPLGSMEGKAFQLKSAKRQLDEVRQFVVVGDSANDSVAARVSCMSFMGVGRPSVFLPMGRRCAHSTVDAGRYIQATLH